MCECVSEGVEPWVKESDSQSASECNRHRIYHRLFALDAIEQTLIGTILPDINTHDDVFTESTCFDDTLITNAGLL